MDERQPKWGRQGRKARREQARALAKEILQNHTEKPGYKVGLFWTVVSICVPLGWGEIVGDHALWRIVVGWILWLLPLVLAARLLWHWSVDRRWRTTFRILPIAGMIAAYLSVASFSVIYAIRSGNAQQSLKAELDQIKKNTEQPPNI